MSRLISSPRPGSDSSKDLQSIHPQPEVRYEMTQSGGTHGRVQDDARKRDTRSEVRAGRATRAEEWLEPEPPGDDQPEATWVLAVSGGGQRSQPG